MKIIHTIVASLIAMSSNGFTITLVDIIFGGLIGLSSLSVSNPYIDIKLYWVSPTTCNIICYNYFGKNSMFFIKPCTFIKSYKKLWSVIIRLAIGLFFDKIMVTIATIPRWVNLSLWWNSSSKLLPYIDSPPSQ